MFLLMHTFEDFLDVKIQEDMPVKVVLLYLYPSIDSLSRYVYSGWGTIVD